MRDVHAKLQEQISNITELEMSANCEKEALRQQNEALGHEVNLLRRAFDEERKRIRYITTCVALELRMRMSVPKNRIFTELCTSDWAATIHNHLQSPVQTNTSEASVAMGRRATMVCKRSRAASRFLFCPRHTRAGWLVSSKRGRTHRGCARKSSSPRFIPPLKTFRLFCAALLCCRSCSRQSKLTLLGINRGCPPPTQN